MVPYINSAFIVFYALYLYCSGRTHKSDRREDNEEDEAGDELDARVARRAGRIGAGRRGGCITLTGSR